MLSSHLILCRPLFLLPPIPPSIRVFPSESTLRMKWPKYWSFRFSIIPSKEHPGLISFRMDWLDLLAVQGNLKSLLQHHSSKASILRWSFMLYKWDDWCSVNQVLESFHHVCRSNHCAVHLNTSVNKIMYALLLYESFLCFLQMWGGCFMQNMHFHVFPGESKHSSWVPSETSDSRELEKQVLPRHRLQKNSTFSHSSVVLLSGRKDYMDNPKNK